MAVKKEEEASCSVMMEKKPLLSKSKWSFQLNWTQAQLNGYFVPELLLSVRRIFFTEGFVSDGSILADTWCVGFTICQIWPKVIGVIFCLLPYLALILWSYLACQALTFLYPRLDFAPFHALTQRTDFIFHGSARALKFNLSRLYFYSILSHLTR